MTSPHHTSAGSKVVWNLGGLTFGPCSGYFYQSSHDSPRTEACFQLACSLHDMLLISDFCRALLICLRSPEPQPLWFTFLERVRLAPKATSPWGSACRQQHWDFQQVPGPHCRFLPPILQWALPGPGRAQCWWHMSWSLWNWHPAHHINLGWSPVSLGRLLQCRRKAEARRETGTLGFQTTFPHLPVADFSPSHLACLCLGFLPWKGHNIYTAVSAKQNCVWKSFGKM